jgi:hypothetical protein
MLALAAAMLPMPAVFSRERAAAQTVPKIKILPLGDSITRGVIATACASW